MNMTIEADPVAPLPGDRRTISGHDYIKHRRFCPTTLAEIEVVFRITPGGPIAVSPTSSLDARLAELTRELKLMPLRMATGRNPAVQAEIDGLKARGLLYCAALLEERHPVADAPASGLFALGDVSVSVRVADLVGHDEQATRSLLDRHRAGDFGAFGRHEDATLDGDILWCPDLVPDTDPATRSAASIRLGSGFIRGRHIIQQPDRRAPEPVDVVTMLRPGRPPATVVWPPNRTTVLFR